MFAMYGHLCRNLPLLSIHNRVHAKVVVQSQDRWALLPKRMMHYIIVGLPCKLDFISIGLIRLAQIW